MEIGSDGVVSDVSPNGAAFAAGFAPAMQIKGFNGRVWSSNDLTDALTAHRKDLTFVVDSHGDLRTLKIEYSGGLRVPHLERISGAPDVLSQILSPRTK